MGEVTNCSQSCQSLGPIFLSRCQNWFQAFAASVCICDLTAVFKDCRKVQSDQSILTEKAYLLGPNLLSLHKGALGS